jgi:4-hydroxybenzoate polyprenyltransferase
MNTYNISKQNKAHFLKRFWIYQAERFPFLAHGLLIASFTFSAVSYSRICRGAEGFIPLGTFIIGAFTTATLFFLVRIFDEFKDAEDDAKFRRYLPVPRGLVSLRELMVIGIITAALQITVNAFVNPLMLALYAVVTGYLTLMGKEFFIAEWLKKRQMVYVFSHMLIIPLIDVYASGMDWLLAGAEAPKGLMFFFAVSFMNGIVLEFGRKIRKPEKEEPGVITYSSLYGANKATIYWMITLFITLLLSIAASWFAAYGWIAYSVLCLFFFVCALPAALFIRNKTEKLSKMIEYASGLWTISMYLTLGGAPMIGKLLNL